MTKTGHHHSYNTRLGEGLEGRTIVKCQCGDTLSIRLAQNGQPPQQRPATEEDFKHMSKEQTPPAGDNGPPQVDDAEVARLLEIVKSLKEERSVVTGKISAARSELKAMGFTSTSLRRIEADQGMDADGRKENDTAYAALRRALKFPIDADGQVGMFSKDDE